MTIGRRHLVVLVYVWNDAEGNINGEVFKDMSACYVLLLLPLRLVSDRDKPTRGVKAEAETK